LGQSEIAATVPHTKIREHGTAPGEVGYEASTRSRPSKPQVIVRLGTDSVNPLRQQITNLVSVALKPQTAKPPGVETDGFAFSPKNAFGAAFSGGAGPGAVLPWSD